MTSRREAPATLLQREAFLLTLLGPRPGASDMKHVNYIVEKVKYALDPWVTRDQLRGALDLDNQVLFESYEWD